MRSRWECQPITLPSTERSQRKGEAMSLFTIRFRESLIILILALFCASPPPAWSDHPTSAVTYDVTFTGNWSADTHPTGFPENAHFSPIIGGVHNDQATFWQRGEMASGGLEDVAEMGNPTRFRHEVATEAGMGTVRSIIQHTLPPWMAPTGGLIMDTFTISATADFPLVTLVTMIAPSPDWFIGVSGLDLMDAQGQWRDSIRVELFPYDAGTEDGTMFALDNADTMPQGTVMSASGVAPFSDQPIATLTFTHTGETEVMGPAPFMGAGEGFFTSAPIADADGAFSHFNSQGNFQGATTLGGAMQCHIELLSLNYVDPTGACGAEEIETQGTNRHYCQFEGSDDLYHSIGETTACIPITCWDWDQGNGVPQVGCTYTGTEQVTATGGSGYAAGSSGSWISVITTTWTDVQPTAIEGYPFTAATFTFALEGEFTLADDSMAPADAFLEIPSPEATVSGVSLISGWSCLGGDLSVEFSDADGMLMTMPVQHGGERTDTASVCGDVNNGFATTFNWNLLGTGQKTARLIRNGEEVAKQAFMVAAFDEEFITGADGMCTLDDFPMMGQSATFMWDESQQGLVLESVQ